MSRAIVISILFLLASYCIGADPARLKRLEAERRAAATQHAVPPAEGTPVAATTQGTGGFPSINCQSWYEALAKSDLKAARAFMADGTGFSEEQIQSIMQQYSQAAASGQLRMTFLLDKSIRNSGVVLFRENDGRAKDLYMIRQNGVWKVLPGMTAPDSKEHNLSDEQKVEYEVLGYWAREQARNYR